MVTKGECSKLLDKAKKLQERRLVDGTRSNLRFHYDNFLTHYVNDKAVYLGLGSNVGMPLDTLHADLERAVEEAERELRDIKKMFPLEINGRTIYVATKPNVNLNYKGVLSLRKKGKEVLTPKELSYLRASSYYNKPLLVRGEGQVYTIWLPNAPYWSSQGMGFVCDFEGKTESDVLGRFVIAPVRDVNLEKGVAYPDLHYAKVLSENQVRKLNGYIKSWEKLTDTGLELPICGRKWKNNLGEICLEDILKPFAPIAFGYDRDYDYGRLKLITPQGRLAVWTKKTYEYLNA